LPVADIPKQTARIMSLQNPKSKMSKSDIDPLGCINLLDSEEEIREKVKKAVTDSESAISAKVHGDGEGAVGNLLTIYSAFSNISYDSGVQKAQGKSYGDFKKELADLIVETLKPIQEKYKSLRKDEGYIKEALAQGLAFSKEESSKTLQKVKEAVGLI